MEAEESEGLFRLVGLRHEQHVVAHLDPGGAAGDHRLTVADDGNDDPRPSGDSITQFCEGQSGHGGIGRDESADQVEAAVGELDELGHAPLLEQQHQLPSRRLGRVDQQVDPEL